MTTKRQSNASSVQSMDAMNRETRIDLAEKHTEFFGKLSNSLEAKKNADHHRKAASDLDKFGAEQFDDCVRYVEGMTGKKIYETESLSLFAVLMEVKFWGTVSAGNKDRANLRKRLESYESDGWRISLRLRQKWVPESKPSQAIATKIEEPEKEELDLGEFTDSELNSLIVRCRNELTERAETREVHNKTVDLAARIYNSGKDKQAA